MRKLSPPTVPITLNRFAGLLSMMVRSRRGDGGVSKPTRWEPGELLQ
jgi:hypothetical protein